MPNINHKWKEALSTYRQSNNNANAFTYQHRVEVVQAIEQNLAQTVIASLQAENLIEPEDINAQEDIDLPNEPDNLVLPSTENFVAVLNELSLADVVIVLNCLIAIEPGADTNALVSILDEAPITDVLQELPFDKGLEVVKALHRAGTMDIAAQENVSDVRKCLLNKLADEGFTLTPSIQDALDTYCPTPGTASPTLG